MARRHAPPMRTTVLRVILAAALGASLAAAPNVEAQTRKPAAARPAKPKPAPPPPPVYTPQERMKTSDEVKQEGVKGAATTPLRDLGVEKTPIPDLLLQALTDPY